MCSHSWIRIHSAHKAKEPGVLFFFPQHQMDYRQLSTLASLFEWWIPHINHISAIFLLLPEKHSQFHSNKNKIYDLKVKH